MKTIKKYGKEWISIRDLCQYLNMNPQWKVKMARENPNFNAKKFKGLPSNDGNIRSRYHIPVDKINLFKNNINISQWISVKNLCKDLKISEDGQVQKLKAYGFPLKKFKSKKNKSGRAYDRYHIPSNHINLFKEINNISSKNEKVSGYSTEWFIE